jgi:hypothetical protein
LYSSFKYSANALRDIRDSFRDNIEIELEVKTGVGGLILPNRTHKYKYP